MAKDSFYLRQALILAKIRRGFCAPNPSVGAIIVNENGKTASGYHFAAGHPHAEIDALSKQIHTKDSTIYVTLEPCCHFGRTPPCTEAIIKAGIRRVVYAYRDPNPIVSGKGEAELRSAGVVSEFLPIKEINDFYPFQR